MYYKQPRRVIPTQSKLVLSKHKFKLQAPFAFKLVTEHDGLLVNDLRKHNFAGVTPTTPAVFKDYDIPAYMKTYLKGYPATIIVPMAKEEYVAWLSKILPKVMNSDDMEKGIGRNCVRVNTAQEAKFHADRIGGVIYTAIFDKMAGADGEYSFRQGVVAPSSAREHADYYLVIGELAR